jgi:hypothetical protein
MMIMGSETAVRRVVVSGRWVLLSTLLALALVLSSVGLAGAAQIKPGSFSTVLSTLQAGAHPDITTAFELDIADGAPRDLDVALPAGLVGAANATPTCPMDTVATLHLNPEENCPASSAVGVATVKVYLPGGAALTVTALVYSVTPSSDEPAAFGFNALFPVRLDANVRSDGDYGITASATNLTEAGAVLSATLTLWGVPADHNGPGEKVSFSPFQSYGGRGSGERRVFLTNPTECSGAPLTSALKVDGWLSRGVFSEASYELGTITGCDRLTFEPSVDVRPDSHTAGAPAGLAVDIAVPQNLEPDGLATPDVRDVSVKLPVGMVISPSAADGLGGCSDEQIGLHSLAPASCPDSSKLGTVQISTPSLDLPLSGEVFLGTQKSQDPQSGEMFRLFIQAAGSGVRVKLPGSVKADPVTGQLTATFASNPQLPLSAVGVRLDGGPHAALVNPATCGTYTTHATLVSWADPTPVQSDSTFTIDQNCAQAGRFEPSLDAGVTNPVAGGSSPFTMTLTRPDAQQELSTLSLALPQGLAAKLAGVPLCPDAQATAGTCSSASQIGKAIVAAGAGPSPLWVPQVGKAPTAVYLGGPYKGAPFSVSVVVPAQAGPFDLGTVVVRAALFVDAHDAHVSVKSDPFPTILDGIPLNLQKINVTVDRPGFMVAPTNCTAMQVSGTAGSSAGASAALASRFQLGSCASLKFAPKFSVSTAGKTSKANGASLTTKLVYPAGSLGAQANVARVKVDLPRQLPSRLATLNKACTSAQFDANPAGCPAGSIVGHAVVHTPLLPVPLTGPAYFVSHGGEAFPSVTVVLQGYGVTVQLIGTTLIRKGITTTTFGSTPDVPFSSFELTFPEGPFSALGPNLPASAKGSMCGQKLVMPTEMVAQNGAVIKRSTPVTATGCPKAKPKHKARAAHKKH